MTDEEAVREVGWVAREARELVGAPEAPRARWAEFFTRKAALLHHLGEDALAAQAEAQAASWQT